NRRWCSSLSETNLYNAATSITSICFRRVRIRTRKHSRNTIRSTNGTIVKYLLRSTREIADIEKQISFRGIEQERCLQGYVDIKCCCAVCKRDQGRAERQHSA